MSYVFAIRMVGSIRYPTMPLKSFCCNIYDLPCGISSYGIKDFFKLYKDWFLIAMLVLVRRGCGFESSLIIVSCVMLCEIHFNNTERSRTPMKIFNVHVENIFGLFGLKIHTITQGIIFYSAMLLIVSHKNRKQLLFLRRSEVLFQFPIKKLLYHDSCLTNTDS